MKLIKLFILLSAVNCDVIYAQEFIPRQTIDQKPISAAELKIVGEQWPSLFGGRKITEGELKPSVYIGNCTATIVGKNTILTAGHCRASGSRATFTYNRVRHTGTCVRHPNYSQNGWLNNDFTLCKFSPEIDLPVYGSLKKMELNVGDTVTMQGYGAGSNGVLNVGGAVIARKDYMDYTTRGKVYLGGGDSGGALFRQVNDLVNGPFYIVGINSRGSAGGYSYFNITALDRSQSWFHDYAKDQNVEICGINKDCQNIEPEPGCEDELMDVDYFKGLLAKATEILKACRK